MIIKLVSSRLSGMRYIFDDLFADFVGSDGYWSPNNLSFCSNCCPYFPEFHQFPSILFRFLFHLAVLGFNAKFLLTLRLLPRDQGVQLRPAPLKKALR
ncbi:MAG: hypothetical protein EZS28_011857 [Streblomastix strix]|uniref:Uncharacterized protein n=1 Tax=Streblomastix strix TaxID=222440 RepID=A0A5J4WCD9_9EUKA|nr:MAG: hypothetical protein EZS28_011857 [Streblomastix strix]